MTQPPPENPLKHQMVSLYPFTKGMNTYGDNTTIPNEAFQDLLNVYPYRGRIRKAMGSTELARLRRGFEAKSYFDTPGSSPWAFNLLVEAHYITDIDATGAPTLVVTTNGSHGLSSSDEIAISDVVGTIGADVNGNTYAIANETTNTFEITQATGNTYTSGGLFISDASLSSTEPNASIACETVEIVIDPSGTPETITDNGDGTLTGTISATGTINYATGAISISGMATSVATTITYYYYPSLPTMGLHLFQQGTGADANLVAFDQHYAYIFNQANSTFSQRGTHRWDSSDFDFFWNLNYQFDSLSTVAFRQIVSNHNVSKSVTRDPIYYWNATDWAIFTPDINTAATYAVYSARFIVEDDGRILLFDTLEGIKSGGIAGANRYQNRLRCCGRTDPFGSTAWISDRPGAGYAIDAPVASAIKTVGKAYERIIVGFENGESYYIKYTENEIQPYLWVRIEGEEDLGGIAPFATISLSKGEMMVGPNGIHVINSNSATRIDKEIPDFSFNILDDEVGGDRVHAIKDTQRELVYITYPRAGRESYFPDRLACYNYDLKTWSFLYGQWTALGYFELFNDYTWDTLPYESWDDWLVPWGTVRSQSFFTTPIGGNQVGWIHQINAEGESDPSLPISAIANSASATSPAVITVPYHLLIDGESAMAVIDGIQGSATDEALNGNRVRLVYITASTLGVQTLVDNAWDNYFLENTAYLGCGSISWVYGFNIKTKSFSPYYEAGYQVRNLFADFLANIQQDCQITWSVYADNLEAYPVKSGIVGLELPRNELANTAKTWHRVDANIEARYITLELNQTDEQLAVSGNASAAIEFHGLKLSLRPGKRFL